MSEINFGGRLIGPEQPPLVIAEIGINHGGSLQTAYEMVDSAASVGVEVVKHQTHVVDDEMTRAAKNVIPGNADESIYDVMVRCALSEEDELCLKEYVESKGMIFLSTPFSRAAAERLKRMGVSAYKIGSGECNNYPLIKHISGFGKPIILSTGMNTLESVGKAVDIFENAKVPYVLLHTTNLYPTPPHLVRLGAMVELAEAFPKALVGLSDHTEDNLACLGAVALGASVLERHFTDHMDRQGPDIVCSMDTQQCRELIESSKTLHLELGGSKGPVKEELVTMNFAFATVVTIAPIKAGGLFTKSNLWVKRPGTGKILAEHYEGLIGRSASRDLPVDIHLDFGDIAPEDKKTS
jgi:sialic acid synthase SpsE